MALYNDTTEPMTRFYDGIFVNESTNCWEWQRPPTQKGGYGQFSLGGVNISIHRFIYSVFIGDLIDDLTIDHLCSNRICANPEHLEQVTRGENTNRGRVNNVAARVRNKTHCKHGHELTGENVYFDNSKGKARLCRECTRRRGREYWRKKRLERSTE